MDTHASTGANLVNALLTTTEDPAGVAHEVGASAAQLGYPLQDVLDTVETAYLNVKASDPDYRVLKAALIAWSDHMERFACEVSCEDPLTTLSTAAHLRSRIDDAYRLCASIGVEPDHEFALIVVQRERRRTVLPLEESLQTLRIARVLRGLYDGDETLAQVAPHRIGVLARRDRADRIVLLRSELEAEGLIGAAGRIWIESLPQDTDDIAWLLSELSR